jgi:hypothetical protein
MAWGLVMARGLVMALGLKRPGMAADVVIA